MTNPLLGEKRTCSSCGLRFFDFQKPRPACPGCGVEQIAGVSRLKPGNHKPFDKRANALAITNNKARDIPPTAAEGIEDKEGAAEEIVPLEDSEQV